MHLQRAYDDNGSLAEVKAAAAETGLPMGCIAVDGAHIFEPSAEAREENRRRRYRWLEIAHDLLAREDIQAVDICLHNNYHMSATVAALEAGKDVFCEKPMAGAYVDALRMWETAQATGRKLAIQFVTMFAGATRAAKYLIDAGHLGHLYHVRSVGHRRRGRPFVDGYGSPTFVQKGHLAGGALYDMGVYHIATALWLIGNPPGDAHYRPHLSGN